MFSFFVVVVVSLCLPRDIAQKQDKGLSWDFPVILVEFSPDSVA